MQGGGIFASLMGNRMMRADVKIADHELAQLVFSHDFAEINTSQSIIIEHFCHHISDFAEINPSIGARA